MNYFDLMMLSNLISTACLFCVGYHVRKRKSRHH